MEGVFDVRRFGASGDGVASDTRAIQAAVDACARAGGGKVYLHKGTFLAGTIYLKSKVTLYLEAGCVLLGSKDIRDYPDPSLIYAEKAENIALLGRGVIDGQGASFQAGRPRPRIVRFIQCTNVTTRDIHLRNSAEWMQHYLECDNVTVDGISVHNRVNVNNNCLTMDGSHNVRVSNCDFSSSDDCFELKSISGRSCRNITVTNCVFSGNCNGFKLGTESTAGFENILISNCAFHDVRLAGIALETVDGGKLDRVNVSNITMENVGAPIFIRLGNRARPPHPPKPGTEKPGVGTVRNIMISHVQATGAGTWAPGRDSGSFFTETLSPKIGLSITGLPDHPVENVTLDHIRLRFKGGGTREDAAREIPELPEAYPEYSMFGVLPAYGFYCRHAKHVKFHHVDLGFEEDDHRPAMVFEDVQDLDILDLDAQGTSSAEALIRLDQVAGAFIRGCRPRGQVRTFVRLDGDRSEDITLMSNDLTRAGQVVEEGEDVRENAVYLGDNRVE